MKTHLALKKSYVVVFRFDMNECILLSIKHADNDWTDTDTLFSNLF